MVLPVICLSYGGSAFLMKLTRGSVLENLGADYVRTARAKGLDEQVILYHHVFRNSLLALITVAANILPALLGGSFIVESIFSIPGMGKLGIDSVQFRDREVVLAVTLIGGLIGLLSQVLRDILYAMADPRVRYD
jgi:peptide/nickel transport system permease protein